MTEKQMTIPSSKRPTTKQLDEREADLKRREEALEARMDDAPKVSQPTPMADDEAIGPNMRRSLDASAERESHGRKNPKSIRQAMGAVTELDASMYIEIHKGKKLMWINDRKGEVQRWINEGAEPVPVANPTARKFEGISDASDSKWVRVIGGDDGNGHFWVYLLMIDPEIYFEIKTGPELQRQQLIRDAILAGADQSHYAAGPKLPSYQPVLPTGAGVGFSEERETIAGKNG